MPFHDELASELTAAAQAGIISDAQADAVQAFVCTRRQVNPADAFLRDGAGTQIQDGEALHFVRGLHDIFMTIGIAMLLPGILLAGAVSPIPLGGNLIALGVAVALSEFLTGQRRLVLPSIALVIAISLLSGWIVMNISFMNVVLGAAAAFGSALAFYWRYRLPFALGVLAAAAVAFAYALLALIAPQFVIIYRPAIGLAAGLIIFGFAMTQDLRDPARQTLKADNAFWLHLLAAPLIVHGLMEMLIDVDLNNLNTVGDAGIILGIVGVLGIVAVLIDRRAMLVSGLTYVGIALALIARQTEISGTGATAATLILLGTAVVALGSGWRVVRRALLKFAPASLTTHLPPSGL